METAANPCFRHSLLHEILYLYHVKEDRSISDPGYLPYYDEDFFAMLRHYKNTVNISVISTRAYQSPPSQGRVVKPGDCQAHVMGSDEN